MRNNDTTDWAREQDLSIFSLPLLPLPYYYYLQLSVSVLSHLGHNWDS
jgi:hypothetical protein